MEGVLIPLDEQRQQAVHILPSDLPDDEAKAEAQFEQILGVLQGEIAHPRYWIEVAVRVYTHTHMHTCVCGALLAQQGPRGIRFFLQSSNLFPYREPNDNTRCTPPPSQEMYYRKGQTGLFQRLLDVLLGGMTEQDAVKAHIYGETAEGEQEYFQDMVRVHNKLAAERAMAALAARRARDEKMRVPLFDEAKRFFDDAARVRGGGEYQYDEETMALQGWASLMVGDNWEGADYFLRSALDVRRLDRGCDWGVGMGIVVVCFPTNLLSLPKPSTPQMAEKDKRTNLLAALGLAIAGFNDPKAADHGQQGVRRARKLLGKVLQQYPACPPGVRLAFGLCCYRLGEMDRARAAFQRCVACACVCMREG